MICNNYPTFQLVSKFNMLLQPVAFIYYLLYNTLNPMSLSTGWHVLYVRSRHEKKVFNLLSKASIHAFLPLVKSQRTWSDRKKTILKPLFPSYVFVHINSAMEFHKALSVEGACAYIRFGREYATVREEEIASIKMLLNLENVVDITIADPPKVGTVKKIAQGPLSGLKCEVLKIHNVNKIIVQIQSIRQNVLATVPQDYLVPCP